MRGHFLRQAVKNLAEFAACSLLEKSGPATSSKLKKWPREGSLLAFIIAVAALSAVARQLDGAVSRVSLGLGALVFGFILFAH